MPSRRAERAAPPEPGRPNSEDQVREAERAVWAIRNGGTSETSRLLIQHGVVAIDYERLADLTTVGSLEELKARYRKAYPDSSEGTVSHRMGQVWSLLDRMDLGDLVILLDRAKGTVSVGRVEGGYEYRPDLAPGLRHARRVRWMASDLPRDQLDRDLVDTFRAPQAIHLVKRDRAESRVLEAVGRRAPVVANGPAAPARAPRAEAPLSEAGPSVPVQVPRPPVPPEAPPRIRAAPPRLSIAMMAAAVVLLVGGGVWLSLHLLANSTPSSGAGSPAPSIPPARSEVTATIRVGLGPASLAFWKGSVWVANSRSGTVSRVDLRTERVTATIPVGGNPIALAVTGRTIWVANGSDGTVSRIDPMTNLVVATIKIRSELSSVVAGRSGVWVGGSTSGTIWQIDPVTNSVVDKFEIGSEPTLLGYGFHFLWVAIPSEGTVSRVDPETNKIEATIPVGRSPQTLATGEGAVWVPDSYTHTVSEIDPGGDRIARVIGTARLTVALSVGYGSVWMASATDGTIWRVNSRTGRVMEAIRVGGKPVAVAAGHLGIDVWVADGERGVVERIHPEP